MEDINCTYLSEWLRFVYLPQKADVFNTEDLEKAFSKNHNKTINIDENNYNQRYNEFRNQEQAGSVVVI